MRAVVAVDFFGGRSGLSRCSLFWGRLFSRRFSFFVRHRLSGFAAVSWLWRLDQCRCLSCLRRRVVSSPRRCLVSTLLRRASMRLMTLPDVGAGFVLGDGRVLDLGFDHCA